MLFSGISTNGRDATVYPLSFALKLVCSDIDTEAAGDSTMLVMLVGSVMFKLLVNIDI